MESKWNLDDVAKGRVVIKYKPEEKEQLRNLLMLVSPTIADSFSYSFVGAYYGLDKNGYGACMERSVVLDRGRSEELMPCDDINEISLKTDFYPIT